MNACFLPVIRNRFDTRWLPLGILAGFLALSSTAVGQTWVPTASGSYSWNSNANWNPATFPNTGASAVLGSGATGNQTIALNTAITISQLTFGDSGNLGFSYDITSGSGGSLAFGSASPAVTVTATTTANQQIDANISLYGNLTISQNSAAATLIVNGSISSLNAFSITISGAGNTIFNGAITYDIGGGIEISGPGNATFNGVISDASVSTGAALFATGTGTVTLGAVNNYHGGTTINSGTLTVSAGGALPNNDTLTLMPTAAGTVLNLNNHVQNIASLTNTFVTGATSTINLAPGALLTFNDFFSDVYSASMLGPSGLVVLSPIANFITLTGTNTVATLMNGNYLFLAQPAAGSPIGTLGVLTMNGGVLSITAASSQAQSNTTIGALTTSGGSQIIVDTTVVTTLTVASLARAGAGTVVFGIGSGIWNTDAVAQFTTVPATTNGIIAPWAIAASGNSGDFIALTGAGNNQIVAAAYTTLPTNGTSSAATVYSTGAATLAASEPAYALKATGALNLGGLTLTLGDGANPAGLILSGSANSIGGPGTLKFNGSEGLIFSGGSSTISAVVAGSNGLTFFGVNVPVIALTGNNSYTGITTISAGATLSVSNLLSGGSDSLGASSNWAPNLVLNNGATLQYSSTTTAGTSNRLFSIGFGTTTLTAGSGSAANTVTFSNTGSIGFAGVGPFNLTLAGSNTGNNTFNPSIGDGPLNATSLTQTGTGAWILGGMNTYTGGTTITGVLTVNPGGSLGTGALSLAGVLNLNNAAVQTINGQVSASAGTLNLGAGAVLNVNSIYGGTLSSTVTGAGGLASGSASLSLGGPNTYSGGTTVSSGMLLADSASALGAGPVTINGGILEVNPGSGVQLLIGGSTGALQPLIIGGNAIVEIYSGTGFSASSLLHSGTGTLIVSAFGSTTSFTTSPATITVNSSTTATTMLPPWAVIATTNEASDFATYNTSTKMLTAVTYSTNTLANSVAGDVVAVSGTTTLSANAVAYALKVNSAVQLGLGSSTLTLGGGAQAGLILNFGSTIVGGPSSGGILFGNASAYINVNGDDTIGATITGTGGVTFFQYSSIYSGVLKLTSVNNNYGNTTISGISGNGGLFVLSVTSSANLGPDTASIIFQGGVLEIQGTSAFSSAKNMFLTTATDTIYVVNPAGATLSGTIAGVGTLNLYQGALTLTGVNIYSGGTNDAGVSGPAVLTVSSGGTLGSGPLNVGFESTLNLLNNSSAGSLTGLPSAVINLSAGAVLTINQSGFSTYAGAISGQGGLTLGIGSQGGTLILTNANTYTGGTTINTGTLVVEVAVASFSGSSIGQGPLTINSGTLLFDTAAASGGSPSIPTTIVGALTTGGGANVYVPNGTPGGVLLAATSLGQTGVGTIAFGGGSAVPSIQFTTNPAAITVNSSTTAATMLPPWAIVQFAPNATDGDFATATLSGGVYQLGILSYSSHALANSVAGDVVAVQPANAVLTTLSGNATAYAVKVGGGDIRQTLDLGGNTLNLGSSTYAGLILNNSTIQNGTVALIGAGYVYTSGDSTISAAVIGSQGLTVFGPVSGSAALTLTSTGNSYGNTNINSNILAVTSNSNLGPDTNTINFYGGQLSILGASAFTTAKNVTLNSGTDTIDVPNTAGATFSGTISGPGVLNKTGAGTLLLTGSNTWSGGSMFKVGIVQVGNGTSGSISGAGNIYTNVQLIFDSATPVTGGGSLNGIISGAGSLQMMGSGTLTLTGDNTYTGVTNVTAGILAINGNQTAATGAVSVSSGGQLQGTGTIGGPVAVGSGSTIKGGNSPGTLNVNANVTLTSTGSGSLAANLNVSLTRTGVGTANASLINLTNPNPVDGIFNLNNVGGPFNINLNDSGTLASFETYTITLVSVPTGGSIELNGVPVGANYSFNSSSPGSYHIAGSDFGIISSSLFTDSTGTMLELTFTPTPEPEHMLLVAAAGMMLFAGMRRCYGVAKKTGRESLRHAA